jgi:superfamily II DNA or RNA helicase
MTGVIGWQDFSGKLPRKLRTYQEDAIKSWFNNSCCGIFAMATGTGKTITAIAALAYLSDNLSSRLISNLTIVICPYLHLVDQWSENFSSHKIEVIEACESRSSWESAMSQKLQLLQKTPGGSAVVVTTIATFRSLTFQRMISRLIGIELLIACDEAHNFGSKSLRGLLPPFAKYRLGLSATPERWMDPLGTEYLMTYFKGVVFELGIREAIRKEILVPYEYHPRICQLSREETLAYIDITLALGDVLKGREFFELDEIDSQRAGILLRQRGAVLGTSIDKQERFIEDFKSNINKFQQLVYCAQGSSPVHDWMGRHIEYIQRELAALGISAPTYEARTSRSERLSILQQFDQGSIPAILSMRCLDEGVDIPSAHISYFISSGNNPREFVQRRGRVLRKSAGKTKAIIYDYFALPMSVGNSTFAEIEGSILKRELDRAYELAECSLNVSEAMSVLEGVEQIG